MPLVIFGVMGIIAGIMALWLPETLCSPMPQTVEQAETWPEDYKIYCCSRPRVPRDEVSNGLTDNGEAKEHGNLVIETPTIDKKLDTIL